ncbi:glycosyltransferase [Listeria fleischmannii]|uniref:Glycosyltransferase n=1 Tax=Listeria fleischmannii FSL S10-1203 TaxID=1265822 RepID=W7DR97_9LIST|nr:glycosyltransferase [Listeria fleischmannii]EUJ47846.1 glycosyltransferase [Listeria fleischmannii FSL S10-1203]
MKVLFFISSFPKLSETFILNQITGLIDRGVEVEILAWHRAFNEADHQAVQEYDLLSKTHFINIPASKWRRLLKASFLFGKLFLKNRRLALETMKWRKYGQMSSSLRLLYSASYFLNREKADAVIAHYGPNGNIANFYKNEGLLEERTMVFFHGQDLTSFVKKWGKGVYRDLFASEISLLPISHYFATKLVHYGASKENVSIHHMGVDTAEFDYQATKIQAPIRFLTTGRLTEKKGMETAIQTMALLKSRLKVPFHLDILGDGERRADLVELISRLDVGDVVTLCGAKTQEAVKAAVKEATIIIQLSKTAENGDMEGIPMVLMEAMSRGKITLSTYHSGIPELIENGRNGFLVQEDSPEQAADLIEGILQSKLFPLEKISLEARETIHREFCLNTWNDRLVKRCKGEKI